MKLLAIITSTLVPLCILATPLATPLATIHDVSSASSSATTRDEEARSVGLADNYEFCDIVNVRTTVDCWSLPKHNGVANSYITSFAGTTKDLLFECYTNCQDVGGNTSWDWATDYDCYVPGYYTDDTCSRANLGECSWADSDTSWGCD